MRHHPVSVFQVEKGSHFYRVEVPYSRLGRTWVLKSEPMPKEDALLLAACLSEDFAYPNKHRSPATPPQ